MGNIIYILLISVGIISFSGCYRTEDTQVEYIKKKYSIRSINYFYELALHDCDFPKKIQPIRKWKNDIYFSIGGDTIIGDRNRVIRAISQINELKLPIKIHQAGKRDKSNLFILFGLESQLNLKKEVAGNSTITWSKEGIEKAQINIKYESLDSILFNIKRQAVILHEIFHSLGLPGHSYTYTNSVLRGNLNNELNEIDKQVIKLLYESALPTGYTGEQFEKVFSDVLYNFKSKEKFLKFLRDEHINKETLESIFKFGLYKPKVKTEENCVVKFTYPTIIKVQADCPPEFIKMLKDAIQQINSSSEEIKLIISSNKKYEVPDGISIIFKKDTLMEGSLEETISKVTYWDLLIPKICKSDVFIKYRNASNMQLVIANALFESICLTDTSNKFNLINDKAYLKPEYNEILKVYYSPSLPSGFTKDELREVIELE